MIWMNKTTTTTRSWIQTTFSWKKPAFAWNGVYLKRIIFTNLLAIAMSRARGIKMEIRLAATGHGGRAADRGISGRQCPGLQEGLMYSEEMYKQREIS